MKMKGKKPLFEMFLNLNQTQIGEKNYQSKAIFVVTCHHYYHLSMESISKQTSKNTFIKITRISIYFKKNI
jgi:hypothetical protein